MTKRKAEGGQSATQSRNESDYTCSAHGCPLRATIFDTVTLPPRNGRCRYHDRLPSRRWPAFTDAVQRMSLGEAAALFGLPYLEPDARKPPRRPPMQPIDPESQAEREAIEAESRPL